MDASPLGRLPGGLRNNIWRAVVVEPIESITFTDTMRLPGILSTCREIRQECTSIYFGENIFRIACQVAHNNVSCPLALRAIGDASAGMIRRLQLDPVELGSRSWAERISLQDLSHKLSWRPCPDKRAQKTVGILRAVGVRLDAIEVRGSPATFHELDACWTLLKRTIENQLKLWRQESE